MSPPCTGKYDIGSKNETDILFTVPSTHLSVLSVLPTGLLVTIFLAALLTLLVDNSAVRSASPASRTGFIQREMLVVRLTTVLRFTALARSTLILHGPTLRSERSPTSLWLLFHHLCKMLHTARSTKVALVIPELFSIDQTTLPLHLTTLSVTSLCLLAVSSEVLYQTTCKCR